MRRRRTTRRQNDGDNNYSTTRTKQEVKKMRVLNRAMIFTTIGCLLALVSISGQLSAGYVVQSSIYSQLDGPNVDPTAAQVRGQLQQQTSSSNQLESPDSLSDRRETTQLEDERISRSRRSPTSGSYAAHQMTSSLLMPINELRVSGSKSEPPSRPSVDWSKQRPHFGTDMVRNVSVDLGKTAYLTCKVFELGDKTVSWLRPRENEILTAGRYTYIGDSRFASINDQGSHDWILEIKDVGLNDSTSYECQVSTDPKMSAIINLQVRGSNKSKDRAANHNNGYHAANTKEAQRTRQLYGLEPSNNLNGAGLELADSSSGSLMSGCPISVLLSTLFSYLMLTYLLFGPH